MRLYLVRHGDTGGGGRFYGSTDLSLSPQGRREAEALRRRLAGQAWQGVFASDLQRALETARIVVSTYSVEACPELREVDFGLCEGLTFEEIEKCWPGAARFWEDPSLGFPGGESLAQAAGRLRGFPARLAGGQGDYLVVGHRGSLALLLCHLLGQAPECWWRFRQDLASLSVVEGYPPALALFNDTSHLRLAAEAGEDDFRR